MGFDPSFECPTCLVILKSSDRAKQSVCGWQYIHASISIILNFILTNWRKEKKHNLHKRLTLNKNSLNCQSSSNFKWNKVENFFWLQKMFTIEFYGEELRILLLFYVDNEGDVLMLFWTLRSVEFNISSIFTCICPWNKTHKWHKSILIFLDHSW